MDAAKLSVIIGGDTRGLDAAFSRARKNLTSFQSFAGKAKDVSLTADPKALQSGIAAGTKQLTGFQRIADRARTVVFGADTRGFTGAVGKAEGTMGSFASAADRASEAFTPTADTRSFSDAVARAEGDLSSFESQAESSGRSSLGFRSTLGAVGGTALIARGNLAALAGGAGLGALALGFGTAAKQGLVLNNNMEQSRIGFTSMLGSAQKADAFLREMQQFAARTPFEFPELVLASQRMLAFGFDAQRVKPLLTAVGNAAAAMGRGSEGVDQITYALGQMKAATVVQAGELNQLTEAGVPAFDLLAKATGHSTREVKDLVANGEIASDVFIDAFQKWAQSNFGDLMAKQAHTASGAFSTLKDNVNNALRNAFEPLYNRVRAGANQLAKFTATDRFQGWANAAASASTKVFTAIESLVKKAEPVLADIFDIGTPKTTGFTKAGQQAGTNFNAALDNRLKQEADNQSGDHSTGYEIGQRLGQAFVSGLKALMGAQVDEGGGVSGVGNTAGHQFFSGFKKGVAESAKNTNFANLLIPDIDWGAAEDPKRFIDMKGLSGAVRRAMATELRGFNFAPMLEQIFRGKAPNWVQVVDKWVGGLDRAFANAIADALHIPRPVVQGLIGDTDRATKGAQQKATQNTNQLRVDVAKNFGAVQKSADKSFSQVHGTVQKNTIAAKNDVSKNTGIMRSTMVKNNTGMQTDTNKKFGSISSSVSTKSSEAKNKQGAAWGQMRSKKSSDETAMENNTKARFSGMSNAVSSNSWDADHAAENAWGQLRSFVSGVLADLGLGGGGGGAPAKGFDKSGSNPHSGGGGPGMARGGIINQAAVGGVADGSVPHAVFGEVGKKEYFIVPERQDNVGYLAGAARDMGFGLVKMARGGVLEAWKKLGVPMHALGATTYNFSPYNQRMVNDIEGKYSTKANTYTTHPGGEQNSVDFWSPSGRGAAIATSVGNAIKGYIDKAYAGYNWLIWQGQYYTAPNTSKPYWDPGDMHFDHLHVTHGASGFGSGAITIANPVQATFDNLLWPPVQRFADSAVTAIKAISPFKLVQAAAGLTSQSVDRIHDFIDAKIPDTIGAPGAHAPQGKSPKGLTIGEAVKGGGFPANLVPHGSGIVGRESGGKADARNPSSTAYGLWQELQSTAESTGFSWSKLGDPIYASKAAYALYKQSGWQPWAASDSAGLDTSWANRPVTNYASGGTLTDLGAHKVTKDTIIRYGEGKAPEYIIPTEQRHHRRATALWAQAGRDLGMLRGMNVGGVLGVSNSSILPDSVVSTAIGNWNKFGTSMELGGGPITIGNGGRVASGGTTTGTHILIGGATHNLPLPLQVGVVEHELGHARFHLGHTMNANSIMRPKLTLNNGTLVPTSFDANNAGLGGAGNGGAGGAGGGSGLSQNQVPGSTSSSGGSGGGSAFTPRTRASGGPGGGSASTSGSSVPTDVRRGAMASERMDKTLRRMEKLLAALPDGILEGMGRNLEHGRWTQGKLMRGIDRGTGRRELGGPMLSRSIK